MHSSIINKNLSLQFFQVESKSPGTRNAVQLVVSIQSHAISQSASLYLQTNHLLGIKVVAFKEKMLKFNNDLNLIVVIQ